MSIKKIRIENAQCKKEAEQALRLSLNSFYPDGFSEQTKEKWEYYWFKDPSFQLENIFLAKNDNDEILGGIRTVSRIVRRADIQFKMFGIGEIFVDPVHQGKGVTTSLVSHIIQEVKRRDYDILVGVARKKIDYFYLRYGIYGLGSYTEVLLRKSDKGKMGINPFTITDFISEGLSTIEAAFEYSYGKSFGPMQRDSIDWQFLLGKMKLRDDSIKLITTKSKVVGYVTINGGQVIEIGLVPDISYRPVIDLLWDVPELDNKELILKIPNTHQLFDEDLGLDITVKNRECYYGGHIVKVLNKKKVFCLLEYRLQKIFKELSLQPQYFVIGNLKVEWDTKKVHVFFPSKAKLSYQETAFLLGASVVYLSQKTPTFLQNLPFFMCPLDEF